jgi:hypothetical protein
LLQPRSHANARCGARRCKAAATMPRCTLCSTRRCGAYRALPTGHAVPAQMWHGVSPAPLQMWHGVGPAPAQMCMG